MGDTSRTLLERVRDPGDAEAWERFFGLYAPLLERYAVSCGLARADAEEVRDQCLAVVTRKIGAFRYAGEKGGFQGWLHRIARGKVVDLLRRPRADRAGTEDLGRLADAGPTPDELWASHWRAEHLRWALERVRDAESERNFRVFELVVLDELSVAQACGRTGLEPAQVYKAKARVLARVREELARLGLDGAPA